MTGLRRGLHVLLLLASLALTGPETLLAAPPDTPHRSRLTMEVGGGQLITLSKAASTVFAADPRIARVQAASPTTLFIAAVAPGRTIVIATSADGAEIATYDVVVGGAPRSGDGKPAAAAPPAAAAAPKAPNPAVVLKALEAALRVAIPGATGLSLQRVPGGLSLAGEVPTANDAHRAITLAQGALEEGESLLDDVRVTGALQVNLRVRVAEVSRTITRELGFNWQALRSGRFNFGLLTGTAAGTAIGSGTEAGRNLIGLGYKTNSLDINGLIDALAEDQLISILAEPNLTAQSGETASFLAGGEFPVPVAADGDRITIEFKQFGVSLAFVPTIVDSGRISLKVRPEVSELSDEGAISVPVSGGVVKVPALRVRRAETTVELGSGQSFAIAGLLQNGTRITNSGLPFLSEVPVLGALFKSDRFRQNDSELVIIITPYIVRPVSDPKGLSLPNDGFRPANDIERILLHRQITRGGPAPKVPGKAGFILE
ncbi:pilus assembly protein CpaC [Stella humosa]|uniref:Pilus assembly protein CpaC n=1 Tax=Stella humosa TaxID=94 RepID=A0A3N1MDG9_9PROT|nr:type II and III secretion system protein family protein [Stella humosa]ROQ01155.1 pilus assembly protein CpaC [Stella humosa]BBK31530.1 fimbriae assembly protein [Stella humosa]